MLDEKAVQAAATALWAAMNRRERHCDDDDALEAAQEACAAYFAALDREAAITALASVIGPHLEGRCGQCAGTGSDLRSNLDCTPCDGTGYAVRRQPWRERAAREVAAEALAALGL